MIEFIQICGMVGILILLLSIVLLVVAVLLAVLCRSRKPLAIFAVAALLPLFMGLLGTAAGYSQVHSVSAMHDSPDVAMIQHGRAQARYTTYLGAGSTGLLLCIVGVAMASKRKGAVQSTVDARMKIGEAVE